MKKYNIAYFWKLTIISIFGFFFSCVAHASLEEIKKNKTLVMCSEIGQIPYEMTDAQGNLYGFDIELARAFASYLSVSIHIKNVQWDGIIPALLTQKCDMILSSMVITPRKKQVREL